MTPVLVSIDKAGDLKIGARKCRLYKKDEVVKVAKKYGIKTEKKTVRQLCGAIKGKAKNSMNNVPLAKLYPEAARKMAAAKKRAEKNSMNNVPLAKLYPEAARKMAAAKKRAEDKALDKKVATNFLKRLTTRIPSPRPAVIQRVLTPTMMVVRAVSPVRIPKPQKKAMPLTKKEAIKRIGAMKGLNKEAKYKLVIRVEKGVMSPRRVVKVARELSKLNAAGYRVFA